MTDRKIDDEIACALGQMRETELPDPLMARILADARGVQTAWPLGKSAARAPARESWLSLLGGWWGVAPLAASAIFGVAIGLTDPGGLIDLLATGGADETALGGFTGLDLEG